LGGVAMYLAFVVASLVFYVSNPGTQEELVRYWLVLAGATLITAVHVYDDVKGLKPLPKLIAQTVAVLIILGPSFDGVFHGVVLFGFNNPFFNHPGLPWYQQTTLALPITRPGTVFPEISLLAIPAVFITWFWMVGMMN